MNKKYDYDFLISGTKYEKQCEYYLYTIYCNHRDENHLLLELKLSCCHSVNNFISNAYLNYKDIKFDDPEYLKNRSNIISMLPFMYNDI